MAVLSLPLSFNNSFWSQDYRKGVEVLFHKLEQGVAENDEIVAFVRSRAIAETQMADALSKPPATGATGTGFSSDDGASLLMTFRGLQAESASQGQAHLNIAKELETLVADPFDQWAQGYKARVRQSRGVVLDQWLKTYEQSQGEVAKLKHQYLAKTRKADEAEDDAKFAPGANPPPNADHYTTSPRLKPLDARSPPQRTASVSERIAARLKEIQKRTAGAGGAGAASESQERLVSIDLEKDGEKKTERDLPTLTIDKGKGKAIEEVGSPINLASPLPLSPGHAPHRPLESPMPPMEPEPMLLAGISFPPVAISQLLTRAREQLPLRPVRFPLLGEYQNCFTGEEFVSWLQENVEAFGNSWDRSDEAAKGLTEDMGLLRRIGELGNAWEGTSEAWYQFRPKAFELGGHVPDPMSPASNAGGAAAGQEIFKRTNNFVNLVSKALAQANAGAGAGNEPSWVRARREAEEADKTYRVAVRQLDRQRLGLEEKLEDTLKTLQRWEIERLRAVKTVLLQYQGTLSNLPQTLTGIIAKQNTLISAYVPETDLTALIERYRTGPFRPEPQVYESINHDESDVVFGIDLRKWAEGGWIADITSASTENSEEKDKKDDKEQVPEVLTALLKALEAKYAELPNDAEKRKTWIYEVPLAGVHHLREALNAVPPEKPIQDELFKPYDAPVIAAAVKLWLLELDPPVGMYEGWEEFRRVYPPRGGKVIKIESEDGSKDEEGRKVHEIGQALQRLPRVHLYVLDRVVKHLKNLIDTTTTDETNEMYITKLALSIGRTILRPKFETEISIQDRHPTLLFLDLLNKYEAILPPTITRKKRESERKIPIRKRTALVDMRSSRSRISASGMHHFLPKGQAGVKSPELPPVPSLPAASNVPPPPIVPTTGAAPTVPPPPPVHVQAEESPKVPPPPLVQPTPVPPPPSLEKITEVPPPPPIPAFKEPPPEDDDLPPRPQFKTPPPEPEDEATPPRPNFVEPPPEPEESPSPSAQVFVPPPPPVQSTPSPTGSVSAGTKRTASSRAGSPSPTTKGASSPSEEQKATVSRSSSGTGIQRSGRITRGPRAPGGGSVSSMVQNINRNSMSQGGSPTSPSSPNSNKRFSGTGSAGGGGTGSRPSSVLGRSAAFSRRTMHSDAEDDVVDRK